MTKLDFNPKVDIIKTVECSVDYPGTDAVLNVIFLMPWAPQTEISKPG